jgi:hypothetical protein
MAVRAKILTGGGVGGGGEGGGGGEEEGGGGGEAGAAKRQVWTIVGVVGMARHKMKVCNVIELTQIFLYTCTNIQIL